MPRCRGVAIALVGMAILSACASGGSPRARPLAEPLTSESQHELRGIYLACDEANRLRTGEISESSIAGAKTSWGQMRDQSRALAEQTAVLVWNQLIAAANDSAALDALTAACAHSGY